MSTISNRRTIIGILALAISGVIIMTIYFFVFSPGRDSIPSKESAVTNAPMEDHALDVSKTDPMEKKLPIKAPDAPAKASEGEAGPPDDAFIQDLREKYKNTLSNKWSQFKAIEKVMEYLEKFYPDDWESHVYDYLKRIFPEKADELYAQFQKNMSYRQWLIDNRQELNMLSRNDRRDRLWDTRYQIFGEDAYEIWGAELKTEQIYESLEKIKEQTNVPFEEKYATYLDAVKQTYGDASDRFIEKRRQELMDVFLSVESVQEDLYKMPVDERKIKLREFRKSAGMDEEALKRWDQLDNERDTDWEKGMRYMKAKEEIAGKYEGDELAQKLQALRVESFGEEWADIVKNEEEAGFYRFKDKRKLGME